MKITNEFLDTASDCLSNGTAWITCRDNDFEIQLKDNWGLRVIKKSLETFGYYYYSNIRGEMVVSSIESSTDWAQIDPEKMDRFLTLFDTATKGLHHRSIEQVKNSVPRNIATKIFEANWARRGDAGWELLSSFPNSLKVFASIEEDDFWVQGYRNGDVCIYQKEEMICRI